MHPFGVEQLAEAKVSVLMEEAEAERKAARVRRVGRPRRRGVGIAQRITRRVDRRRLRDLAI